MLETLKTQGYRITRVRRALTVIFERERRPLLVSDLLTRLARQDIACNKTTVYRELEFLQARGFVRATNFRDGATRYERAEGDVHHHHMVCVSCDKVEDVDMVAYETELKRTETRVYQQRGFRIAEHMLELFGLCRSCDSKQATHSR